MILILYSFSMSIFSCTVLLRWLIVLLYVKLQFGIDFEMHRMFKLLGNEGKEKSIQCFTSYILTQLTNTLLSSLTLSPN